jgi:hypothetical protein
MKTTLAAFLLFAAVAAVHAASPPETVLVTYRAKAGSEAQVENLVRKQWATLQRLALVTPETHVLVRDRATFTEVFSWKSADIPDAAPAEVTALWTKMGKVTEKIEIREVRRIGN